MPGFRLCPAQGLGHAWVATSKLMALIFVAVVDVKARHRPRGISSGSASLFYLVKRQVFAHTGWLSKLVGRIWLRQSWALQTQCLADVPESVGL